jgi:hypothetical protein
MTVSAAIEIGPGETSALGLGKTPGTMHSAERAGAAASGQLSSTVSAATSFRAGWQSLLATLSSNLAVSGETEADQETTFAGAAAGQISDNTSVTTLATGNKLLQGQGTEKERVETGVETMLSSAETLTQTLLAEPAAGVAKPASTSVEENNLAAEPGTESATESTRSSRTARSTNATRPDAISAEPLPGVLPAATASLLQTAPSASVVNQVTQSTDGPTQLAQTEISAALSTDQQPAAAFASLNTHSQVAVNATMLQRQASPVSNLSGSSGSTLSEAESVTPATARSLTQAAAQNASPADTLMPSHAPSQTLVSNQYRTPTLIQSQEQVAVQQENLGVNVSAAPMPGDGLNPLPRTAAQSGLLSAPSSAQNKPGSAGGGKTSTSNSIHGIGNSVQHVSQLNGGQPSVPAVDSSAMARALAGASGTVSTTGNAAGTSSIAATNPDSREAFATLDAAGAPVATTWIHAGTQRAEAGYQDPALGWVGVRADLSGGGIHAQLVPGSADAAQALDGHLAGLNAYLAEHHTPVETLTLTAPESGSSGLGNGQGTGEGTQQGTGQQSAQGADASTPSGQYSEPVIQSPAASAELPAFFGDMDGSTQPANLDGFHISVMA